MTGIFNIPRIIFLLLIFSMFSSIDSTANVQNIAEQVVPNKSLIQITSPGASTVWELPNVVTIKWSTEHISTEKNIRFFLVRDEMVAQELGIFPNTGIAENITLAKNIGTGNQYQVMGIELFPDDKYNIAKFVTPFFSIVKQNENRNVKDAIVASTPLSKPVSTTPTLSKREKRRLQKEQKEQKKSQELQTVQKEEKLPLTETAKENDVTKAPALREEFVGRNITYVKDLVFDNPEISIYIWDHGRQDGDIVSIYLNGEPVLTKYYLTYWKKEIKIKIDPTKPNDLFLYAHNLGTAPPNTVSLKITDGTTTTEDIILNSDLKSCEAVSVSVSK